MNGGRIIGSWSAQNTDVGSVEAAIRRLRARHERGAMRTAAWTVLALIDDDETQTASVMDVVRELAGRVPVQALVISTRPRDEPGIDVRVTLRALERRGGATVCVEDISIRARGPSAEHLGFVVEPFALPGLPVALWLPNRLPRPGEPLVARSDRVLLDTNRLGQRPGFASLLSATSGLTVVDLSWVRLEPWRRILASLFLGADFSPFLSGVDEVDVEGQGSPMLLLAGWLMSRLRGAPQMFSLGEASDITVRIRAKLGSRRGAFVLVQDSEERRVRVAVAIEDGPSYHRVLAVPVVSLAGVIDRALAWPADDMEWRAVLAAVAELIAF